MNVSMYVYMNAHIRHHISMQDLAIFKQNFPKSQMNFGDAMEFHVVGNTLSMVFKVGLECVYVWYFARISVVYNNNVCCE